MGLTSFIVQRRVVAYFFVVLLTVGGVLAFRSLGQLEDPDFTVKKGVVITQYPGASPEQVELEVTDRLEKAIQELPQLDNLISFSRAGVSIIKVEIKEVYWADRLPQVWDDLRKKVRDARPQLPPGAQRPRVVDDFAFVYGFVLAITGDGFNYAELEEYADGIKKELSLVSGVARVELWGVQDKVVYLDVAESQLAALGLTPEDVALTLEIQNRVVDAGSIDIQDRRLRVAPTGEFQSPLEIGDLAVRTLLGDTLARLTAPAFGSGGLQVVPSSGASVAGTRAAVSGTRPGSSELLRIRDVANVRSGYLEPPRELMRFNGRPALAIYAANVSGGNVVETGRALDARIGELLPELPVGIEIQKIAWQSDLVTESIDSFMVSLAQAIGIVLVVLIVPSGVRMGFIIGSMLVLIILGTFVFMSILGIDLHRMSLGALIIALGMMVDNSTFVADDMRVRMQRGTDRVKAALEAAGSQAWGLLGATIIAVMAFYAIYASPADAGEYCRSLFTVVAIALILSWLVSMTLTPVMCIDLLPEPAPGADAADPYDTRFFRMLKRITSFSISNRYLTIGALSGLLAVAFLSYPLVPQMFFPDATRNQLMVDYWSPEGSPIRLTAEGVKPIEEWLMNHDRVTAVSTFIGNGPPRFYLPVDPELPNPSFAEIIVNTHSYEDIQPLADELGPWLQGNVPVMTRLRKYGVGPADTWKLEARISGPSEADLGILRRLGEEGMAILRQSPLAREIRTEMREPVKKLVPAYNQERGVWATISRQEVADATKRAYDGLPVGLYREGDDLYPILLRNVERERRDLAGRLPMVQILPQLSTQSIPLGQVVDGVEVAWEDPIIHRWNRRRANSVQASPIDGETFPSLYASVAPEFDELEANLPPGYEIFWDGELDSTLDAQASLLPGIVPGAVVICTIIVLLYSSIRVLLCILLVVPFAGIGIIFGLIAFDSPMGFIAILGVLSLTGMMIKNMIVMTGSINGGIERGLHPFDACVHASVSQARPIMLAAGTTVLGVLPLFPDPFWNALATVIMAGLGVGAVLTLVLYPTLYATLHGIRPPETETGTPQPAAGSAS
jgi:multidrug efflux pump subunit AcrB